MALDQMLCFQALKRNDLYLFFTPFNCSLIRLQSVSPVTYFFCLGNVVEQMIKGSRLHIFGTIYVFHLKPVLSVSVYFVCMPMLSIHVEALNSSGPLRTMLWLVDMD